MVVSLLTSLGEDVLVDVVSFLEPPDISRLAQTCKLLHRIASIRLVWVHASKSHVILRGFPFPEVPLDGIPTRELIAAAKRGFGLGRRWRSGMASLQTVYDISGFSGPDVRFISGHGGRLLAMISKSVWYVLSVWDISDGTRPRKVCEWGLRGGIFTGVMLNSDGQSPATIAVSLHLNEKQFVKILGLHHTDDHGYVLTQLYSVDTAMVPVTLAGDVLALGDSVSRTMIWNWKKGTHALLEHPPEDTMILQSNKCIQVVLVHQSILVARARSLHLFPFPHLTSPINAPPPVYQPIAHHSFGWVDGQCMKICPLLDTAVTTPNFDQGHIPIHPISILVRGEVDDPWASTTHNLELYTLYPNPEFSVDSTSTAPPYQFPPRLSHTVASLRGSLQCKAVLLGSLGTALWVQPRDHFESGLLADGQQLVELPNRSASCETLMAAVFPGSLSGAKATRGDQRSEAHLNEEGGKVTAVVGTKIYENQAGSSWSSIDYDEAGGRVALGSSFGPVQILYL
ncbi:hypothetical protein HYPSUDRAFT_65166 [Hypholoma sublateritium FD-334 SS-4]|uniref:F-box domain-containing protein n=1 Tax=Hypholoma sublateritium (strain FD-334 SS-4) TaxID=945553 RepID=A0A0D2PZU4_HYPSF|nr:hypothetical protein HYPSUDRAFT_65166 [Hypholoma sublateritium FD-334 SS-4]